jgi:vancomycin resistance protein YoaR
MSLSGSRARFGAAVALLVAAGLLGGFALTPAPPVRAAADVAVSLAGAPLPATNDTPEAAAQGLARRYLRGSVTLVAGDVRVTRTRAQLGAVVDTEHLAALLAEARDPRSALRRVHEQTHGVVPVDVPMPATLTPERALPALISLKSRVDRAPEDARVDVRAGTVRPERAGQRLDVYGGFDALAEALRDGRAEVALPIELRAPHRRAEELAGHDFSQVIGEFETRYNPGEKTRDRTYNLRVGAGKIDGYVLLPGETLDFNEVVGERSEANGFRIATVIADGELGEGVGGGTCQVAGTLHAAAYFAGLPIVERGPHSRPSFYIKMGMDAMVSYPDKNLRFTNDLPFPVALGMTVRDGIVHAEVRGHARSRMVTFVRRIDRVDRFEERDEPDPSLPTGVRVLKQRGIPGFRVSRWRVVRDVTRNQARRQRSEDTYPATAQIWRVGTGGAARPGFVQPPDDDHPEYTADAYLIATQGPGITGTQESKRAGRTGTPGWTVREGFARAVP